jgi:integrase
MPDFDELVADPQMRRELGGISDMTTWRWDHDFARAPDRRSVARDLLKRLEGQIERGEYPPHELPRNEAEPTFLSAALAYMESGRPSLYIAPLIKHFGDTPLSEIDQNAIDNAASTLYPNKIPSTRNRYLYTPMSAILHFAGIGITVRRPKGFKGRVVTDWLTPDDAFGIIEAADKFDRELGTLLCWLLYTGARIGAALDLRREDVQIEKRRAWARSQKGQPHMDVRLHPDLCERLDELLKSHDRHAVFRSHYGGHLLHSLCAPSLANANISKSRFTKANSDCACWHPSSSPATTRS